ncbi:MAG: S8 family serine peptidase, partial [Actinomycetota bacterium]
MHDRVLGGNRVVAHSVRVAFGISWDDSKKNRIVAAFALCAVALSLTSSPEIAQSSARFVSVIVRELPGSSDGPEAAVEDLGGQLGRHIKIIDAFVARVPEGALSRLHTIPGIHSVTADRKVQFLHDIDGFNPASDAGSMYRVVGATRADWLWKNGLTGAGVDVAVIDTGVVPVDGLTAPGKVINGPDLSFESQADNLRYLDTYGHGTHIAGIIAGRDDAAQIA